MILLISYICFPCLDDSIILVNVSAVKITVCLFVNEKKKQQHQFAAKLNCLIQGCTVAQHYAKTINILLSDKNISDLYL